VHEYRSLGVTPDTDLTFQGHIRELGTKTRRRLGALGRLAGLPSKPSANALRICWLAFGQPCFEHAASTYFPFAAETPKLLQSLVAMRTEAARTIFGLAPRDRANRKAMVRGAGLMEIWHMAARGCVCAWSRALCPRAGDALGESVCVGDEIASFAATAGSFLGGVPPVLAGDVCVEDPAAVSISSAVDGGSLEFDVTGEATCRGDGDWGCWVDGATGRGQAAAGFIFRSADESEVREAWGLGGLRGPYACEQAAFMGAVTAAADLPGGGVLSLGTDCLGLLEELRKETFKLTTRVGCIRAALLGLIGSGWGVRVSWIRRGHNGMTDQYVRNAKKGLGLGPLAESPAGCCSWARATADNP